MMAFLLFVPNILMLSKSLTIKSGSAAAIFSYV